MQAEEHNLMVSNIPFSGALGPLMVEPRRVISCFMALLLSGSCAQHPSFLPFSLSYPSPGTAFIFSVIHPRLTKHDHICHPAGTRSHHSPEIGPASVPDQTHSTNLQVPPFNKRECDFSLFYLSPRALGIWLLIT